MISPLSLLDMKAEPRHKGPSRYCILESTFQREKITINRTKHREKHFMQFIISICLLLYVLELCVCSIFSGLIVLPPKTVSRHVIGVAGTTENCQHTRANNALSTTLDECHRIGLLCWTPIPSYQCIQCAVLRQYFRPKGKFGRL